MSDIVDDLKMVAAAPNLLGPAAGWCGKAAEEILRLRAEVEELRNYASQKSQQVAELQSDITTIRRNGARREAEAMERAAQIVDDMPARSNYAIYDAIAAAIRAEASKKGGEG